MTTPTKVEVTQKASSQRVVAISNLHQIILLVNQITTDQIEVTQTDRLRNLNDRIEKILKEKDPLMETETKTAVLDHSVEIETKTVVLDHSAETETKTVVLDHSAETETKNVVVDHSGETETKAIQVDQ